MLNKDKQQLEKFSDRAIGVAIASLILFFSLPLGRLAKTQEWSLAVPHLIFFFFSLYMINVFWTAQSRIIDLISKTDMSAKVILIIRCYFVSLALLPFAAGWIADEPYLPASVLLYAGNLLVIAVLHFMLLHAALNFRKHRLWLLNRFTPASLKKTLLAGPAFYLIAVAMSYVNIYFSFMAILAAGWFYAILFNKKIDVYTGMVNS